MSDSRVATRPEPQIIERPSDDTFHHIDRALAPDLLRGVAEIAIFLFGNADKKTVRKLYHITEYSSSLPVFKKSGLTCAFKSSIRAKFWMMQQRRAWEPGGPDDLMRLHVLLTHVLHLASATSLTGNLGDHRDHPQLWSAVAEAVRTIERILETEDRSEPTVEHPLAAAVGGSTL